MDFAKYDAKDILVAGKLDEYKSQIEFFHLHQLTHLNSNIFVMDKISTFPFNLFLGPDITFWYFVGENFYVSSVLIITRLTTDQKGSDLNTLLRFKNWLILNIRPEYKEKFKKYIKIHQFDKEMVSLFEKARSIRDSSLAHIKSGNNVLSLKLSDLRSMRDSLNQLLGALSFNVELIMLPIGYNEGSPRLPKDADNRSDIERILDCLARDSNLLNMPEQKPDIWQIARKQHGEKVIEIINNYRKKFGLPEA